jgi:hypothetical protein
MSIPRFAFISCPHCQAVLKRLYFMTGNTFGSTLWTDGYNDGPMLPAFIHEARCPFCAGVFFLRDAKTLPQLHWTQPEPESYRKALCVNPHPMLFSSERNSSQPQTNSRAADREALDVILELISQTENHDRLWYLRTRLWHIHNHSDRNAHPSGVTERPESFNENLEILIELINPDCGENQLLKAEALRELGRHDAVMPLLENIDSEHRWAADQIVSLAQAGNTVVSKLLRPRENQKPRSHSKIMKQRRGVNKKR